MNDNVEAQKHRLAKKAGSCAATETFARYNGHIGYLIRCRVCHHNGVSWSTKMAAKNIGRRKSGETGTWDLALTLWVAHMKIHHSDRPQPDWHIPKDADPIIEKVERSFNITGELSKEASEEAKLLREIFGE